jgi:anaerobilin synthase
MRADAVIATGEDTTMTVNVMLQKLLFGSGTQPYRAFVPQSVKIYPIHQLLPTLPPPPAGSWDPVLSPDTSAYLASYGEDAKIGRQLYMHIPFCPAFCHFCCLYKTMAPDEQGGDFIESFVRSLLVEIEFYGRMAAARSRPITSIYFGGGTPSVLSAGQVERILNAVQKHLPLAEAPEISFEGMAHQLKDPDYLRALCANGVNRISYGVQTFQPFLRRQLGRLDTVEDIQEAREAIRARPEIRDLNFELLIGIPNQDLPAVIEDLEATVRAQPESTDVLFYNAVPGTRYYDMIRRGTRTPQPAGDPLLEMRREVIAYLTANGYHHATGEIFDRRQGHIDEFNGTHYGGSTGLDEMLALGPSSYGFLHGTVYQNIASVRGYMECIRQGQLPIRTYQPMDATRSRRRGLLFGLQLGMIHRQVVSAWNRPLIASWRARDLVRPVEEGWALTSKGKLWYNMMQLEAMPLNEAGPALDLTLDAAEQRRLLFRPQETSGNVLLARELERIIEGPMPLLRPFRRTLFRIMGRLHSRREPLSFTGPGLETS